ncbi:Endoribonuclease L-PSP/chorismate mutase-like protein [Hyaloraphidium curvatum]|nr:Endoribonuclease L-PSP/chorismate mutase-like protein [Hyaloraphidium curvatum]
MAVWPQSPTRRESSPGPKFFTDAGGPGNTFSSQYHYSQAVRLGGIVKLSGQGGWDLAGGLDGADAAGQVKLAFDNIDRILREAGLRGWEDVYLVRSFHVDKMPKEGNTYDYTTRKLKERLPGHRPVWTAVAVPELAFPGMLVEIEVEALVGGDASQAN